MPRWLQILLFASLSACTAATQTTSGTDYTSARPKLNAADATTIDKAVERAASVEPLLRFPARLGLARLQGGTMIAIPPNEADAWVAFAQAHPEFGNYVPISPLIAEMVTASASRDVVKSAVDRIRLGAARQHVDAVLIYTVATENESAGTALSFLDLTLIGGFLIPSRDLKGQAVASGLLVDVRNGYPYGIVSAVSRDSALAPRFTADGRREELREQVTAAAVTKLTEETGQMLSRLRTELQEKELRDLRAQAGRPTKTTPAR